MPARDEPDLDPVLADVVRRAVVRPVDEVTASRHLDAIVAAARVDGPAPVRSRPRRRPWRPLLAGAAAMTLLLPVGLAAAGVALPAVVEQPYSAVGITLPNQSSDAPPRPPAAPGAPARTATSPARGSRRPGPVRAGGSTSPAKRSSNGRSGAAGGAVAPPAGSAKGQGSATGKGAARGDGTGAGNGSAGGAANANGAKAAPKRGPAGTPRKPATAKPAPSRGADDRRPATTNATSHDADGRRPRAPAKPATPQSTQRSQGQGALASPPAGGPSKAAPKPGDGG